MAIETIKDKDRFTNDTFPFLTFPFFFVSLFRELANEV